MDPCISHDYQFIILSLLVSCIPQLSDSDIRTLAGDRWREMGTEEGGGWGWGGLSSRSALKVSRFAPLIRSSHLYSFQPGNIYSSLSWKSSCSDLLKQWPPFQPPSKQQKFFCRSKKVIRFPYFRRSKKKNPITFNSLRQTYKGKLLCRLLNVFELPREAQ